MAVSAWASAPTSSFDYRLRTGRKTVLANLSSFPPESRAIQLAEGRNRWTDGQGSCQGPTGVHWRGWTGFTMELSLERQADWLRGFRALGHYSVMWLGNGAREAQTCTPLSRAVPRQGWRTWCERLGVRRRSGSSARWSGSTDDFCQPRQSGRRPCVSWQEWD